MIYSSQEGLEQVVVDYFSTLFTSSNSSQIDAVIDQVERIVTDEMNESLCRPYTEDEIVQAINQMHPSKASGPDLSLIHI